MRLSFKEAQHIEVPRWMIHVCSGSGVLWWVGSARMLKLQRDYCQVTQTSQYSNNNGRVWITAGGMADAYEEILWARGGMTGCNSNEPCHTHNVWIILYVTITFTREYAVGWLWMSNICARSATTIGKTTKWKQEDIVNKWKRYFCESRETRKPNSAQNSENLTKCSSFHVTLLSLSALMCL